MTITWTPHLAPQPPASSAQPQPIDVEAWTAAATEALGNVAIATGAPPRGTVNALAIPLDDGPEKAPPQRTSDPTTTPTRPRTPIRRDSLVRREALLKGREGTRRRLRWENDHLLSNPHATPPQPHDWEIRPTYPRHGTVPYFLAPLWDPDSAFKKAAEARAAEKKAFAKQRSAAAAASTGTTTTISAEKNAAVKELRAKLKRAKAAKGLLQDLEEEVRKFVEGWARKKRADREEEEEKEEGLEGGRFFGESESESDEEVVFVGRGGRMRDVPPSPTAKRGGKGDAGFVVVEKGDDGQANAKKKKEREEKMVYWSLEGERGAGFGRWLVHSIASYYGLRAWSVTVGDPARREAYVGIDAETVSAASGADRAVVGGEPGGLLPRPLWGLV